MPYYLRQSSKGTPGSGHAVVKVLADCGIIGDDATQDAPLFDALGDGEAARQ